MIHRGQLSSPVLAVLATLLLVSIGVSIVVYLVFFTGEPRTPVVAVKMQPVACREGDNAIVEAMFVNTGNRDLPGGVATLTITFPEGVGTSEPVNTGPIPKGASKTLHFTFPGKGSILEKHRFATGTIKIVDPETGNTIEHYEVGIRIFTIGCPTTTSPGQLDLILVERAAIYYDTFDTNPFNSRLVTLWCNKWKYDSVEKAISIVLETPKDWRVSCGSYVAGLDIASYLNQGKRVYTSFLAFRTHLTTVRSHFFHPEVLYTSPIELAGLREYYHVGYQSSGKKCVRETTSLRSAILSSKGGCGSWMDLGSGNILGSYYLTHISASIESFGEAHRLVHWINRTRTHELTVLSDCAVRGPIHPGLYGLVHLTYYYYDITPGSFAVYFDNFVVSVGRPAWIVEVENVPVGWRVVVRSASGVVIDEGVAGSDGVITLYVIPPEPIDLLSDPNNRDWLIIPNGVIEVYDQNGNKVLEKPLPLIVGGDRYKLIRP